jgi:hypothetical protein
VGGREAQEIAARQAFKLPGRTDLDRRTLPDWAQRVLAELKPIALDWRSSSASSRAGWRKWDRSVRWPESRRVSAEFNARRQLATRGDP